MKRLFIAALIAQGFRKDVEVSVTWRRVEPEDVGHPGIEIDVLKGNYGLAAYDVWSDRKSTRLNSSHFQVSRMPSSA